MNAGSVAETMDLLQRIVDEEADRDCRLALFPALYLELTQRLSETLEAGEFENPAAIRQIAVRFANRYFDAFSNDRNGGEVSKSWQIAFDEAKAGRLLAIQDLLLGVNAHINLDLAVATAEVGGREIEVLERDFNHINVLLEDLFDRAQHVLNSVSPLLHVLDGLGGRGDEWLGNFILRKARDSAWANALYLATLPSTLRPTWVSMLDTATGRLGRMISAPGFIVSKAVDLIRETEERNVKIIVTELAKVQEAPRAV